jgi:ferredoxin-type protein NapG
MLKPGDATRRDLLRSAVGDWLQRLVAHTEDRIVHQRYFRPPGALSEIEFLAACTRCGACIDACPPHALVKVGADGGLAAGTPYLDFTVQPCIACEAMPCAAACHTGALTLPPGRWNGYRLMQVQFHPERCLTFRGTACRVCADACPVGEAALVIDDAGHPVLRREGCVGCGGCAHACVTTPSSFELAASSHDA